MTADIGTRAPDFDLMNQYGQRMRLGDFRGRSPVMLVFFPLAFSAVCIGELHGLHDNLALFRERGVQLIAISVDSKASLRAWSDGEAFDFPLLADFWPHGAVSQQYGAFIHEKGYAARASFLIDSDGVVRASFASTPGEPRSLEQYCAALGLLR